MSLYILLPARLHSCIVSPYSSWFERWWQQIEKKCRQICLHQVKWIYIAHNLLCISCKMLKMAVWQPAIFMPFYEEKYGRYAAFCLIYAFVRSAHIIILRHPACISFTNRLCSFCLQPMFLTLTSDISVCPQLWFMCFTVVNHITHNCEARNPQL